VSFDVLIAADVTNGADAKFYVQGARLALNDKKRLFQRQTSSQKTNELNHLFQLIKGRNKLGVIGETKKPG
jgi:hypothetical protein